MERNATIDFMAGELDKSTRTVQNYLAVLTEAHVSFTISGRGTKGDPKHFKLDETLSRAQSLITKYFAAQLKRQTEEHTNQANNDPLGVGIASWLFLTPERAIAYSEWSKPWTKD